MLNWILKEDLLKDAMEVGKIAVLEFVLQVTQSFSDKFNEELIEKAETK